MDFRCAQNKPSPVGEGGSRRLTDEVSQVQINSSSTAIAVPLPLLGKAYFVRPESPSTFPDKHCFCGHKSEAPREAGQNIILKLAIYFLLLVIFHRNASTQTEDFHPRNKGNRKPYYIRHYCRSAKNHILIHEPKEMYVLYS